MDHISKTYFIYVDIVRSLRAPSGLVLLLFSDLTFLELHFSNYCTNKWHTKASGCRELFVSQDLEILCDFVQKLQSPWSFFRFLKDER